MYATGQVLLKYAAVSLAYCKVRLIILLLLINREWGHYSRPSDKGAEKNGKLSGNFWQYYAEESDDYGEKTPDYAEISKINKDVLLAFSNV